MSELWSWEKPTEPGLYFVVLGDVVSKVNLNIASIYEVDGELFDAKDGCSVDEFNPDCKFLKVDIKELNDRGNAE